MNEICSQVLDILSIIIGMEINLDSDHSTFIFNSYPDLILFFLLSL